ncbi:MAG: AraC family transcriptional regulator [Clostridia bacterium]|nr:AraC family transcriptional regulator [Clostridia bacterium]NCC43769.1 AraC family transcriptional regulator [Clostridia bacterium]
MKEEKTKPVIPIQRCYPEDYLVHQVRAHYLEGGELPVQEFCIRFRKDTGMVMYSNACTLMSFEQYEDGKVAVRFIGRITETMQTKQQKNARYIMLRFPPQYMFEKLKGVVNQEIYLDLEDFGGEEAVRMAMETTDPSERFEMLMKLITDSRLHFWMSDIVNQFVKNSMGETRYLSLEELIAHITYTPRYVRDIIKEYTGISAKRLYDILRLQSIMEVQLEDSGNVMDCVYDFGFYDQTHLNKNIKKLTGLTYSAFRQVLKEKNR